MADPLRFHMLVFLLTQRSLNGVGVIRLTVIVSEAHRIDILCLVADGVCN